MGAPIRRYAQVERSRLDPPPPPAEAPASPDEPEPTEEELRFRDWLAIASPAATNRPSWQFIIDSVSARTGVREIDIVSEHRSTPILEARSIACWLMRELTVMSYASIGGRLGGRDHSTALNACRRINERISDCAEFAKLVQDLKTEISARAAT